MNFSHRITIAAKAAALLAIVAVLLGGCAEPEPKVPGAIETESIDLGKWTGTVAVLPTGERILLTRFHNCDGTDSTAAVLLPPLPVEDRSRGH